MKQISLLCLVVLLSLVANAQIKSYPNATPNELGDFWTQTLSANKNYQKHTKRDNQALRALRSDFKERSMLVLSQMEEQELFYEEDLFLTDYLTNLVQLLSGGVTHKNRTMATARLMFEASPNACAYPDGTLVFNTRLIAMMDCEEELLGVVAHELAHYMLEHAVTNYVAIEKAKKNKAIWSSVAMIAATAAGTVADISNGGDGSAGVLVGAELGVAIGEAIYSNLEHIGYKFSQEQELEADAVAIALLEQIGVSPNYYASVLNKLRLEDYRFGREIVKTKKSSTHPALDERIDRIGGYEESSYKSEEYDLRIAHALTIDAYIERNIYKDFTRTLAILDRIERASPLTLDDYLIKIPTLLDMSNTTQSNEQALNYLQEAMKGFNDPGIESLCKYEAMIYVRLKRSEEAKTSLERYRNYCEAMLAKVNKKEEQEQWSREKSWAENAHRRL